MSYTPGQPLILSRLPAQDWFSVQEAADHSGWGRSYITDRIKDGTLPAQEFQKPEAARAKGKGPHKSYRIHVDDLVFFIIKNGSKRYTEEKTFADIFAILRRWPAWMRRELITALQRSLAKP